MIKFAVKLLKNQFFPLICDDNIELSHGQYVLVETEKGEEAVKVHHLTKEISKCWEGKKIQGLKLIRIMSESDLQQLEEIRKNEITAVIECKKLIEKHKLNMNLVQCHYTFDRRKLSFYYTAPERVDFRGLLKDLTQVFKRVRIDLRHIGVRDETSILCGNGLCGRPFCCCSWLRNFESINVKLAHDQGMPITPGKISGTCGRLLCCLNYEYKTYIDAAKGLPPVGSGVMTPDGVGKVSALHFLNGRMSIKMEDGKIKDFSKDEVEMIDTDVNIELDNTYCFDEEGVSLEDLKKLEDDRNSSTGNV